MTASETASDRPTGDAGPADALPSLYRRAHTRLHANPVTAIATKIVVTIVGVAVLLAGVVMMVTPGPGIVGVIVGLGILASEYAWADRWVQAARRKARKTADRAREMDPAVRRRRALLTAGAMLLVGGAALGYLVAYDWPGLAVTGWDQVQGISGAVPELPGM